MTQNTEESSERQITIKPYFGGFILETLTIGMYGDSRNAIREYLQNAFDAVQKAIDDNLIRKGEALITITILDDGLFIRDNGTGLSSDIAVATLTSIGASSKNYRREAGFRGIGRLAGIVFCNRLTFTTKAPGETIVSRVVLDAAGLRRDMSPAKAGQLPLEDLLKQHVTAFEKQESDNVEDHFFEVALEGYENAPVECTDSGRLIDFVCQIAPVPYHGEFAFAERIQAEAKQRGTAIDAVRIIVVDGDKSIEAFKPYKKEFPVGKDGVTLSDCKFYDAPSKHWWGWVGHKTEPGAYKDELSKAIRVRVRNIQIDGTQILGNIFGSIPTAPSYGRFNDWYLGEIFVEPTYLVPNARRDGFEDDEHWRLMRNELIALCTDLGKSAYEISRKHQHSIDTLTQDTRALESDTKKLVGVTNPSTDKLIELSNSVTKLQRRVSRALRHADLEVTSQLRSLENRLLDVKTKAVRTLGAQTPDPEEIREEAQRDLISSLMKAFRKKLDPPTYAKVARIASEVLGTADF
jgi:hypothetical protein